MNKSAVIIQLNRIFEKLFQLTHVKLYFKESQLVTSGRIPLISMMDPDSFRWILNMPGSYMDKSGVSIKKMLHLLQ